MRGALGHAFGIGVADQFFDRHAERLRESARVLLLVLIFSLDSCATEMSERASRVQVISASEAKQYQFVANLSASSSLTGVVRQTGYQNALTELLDKAAAAGAEFVVLDPKSGPSYWTTSEIVRGTAYRRNR